MKGICSCYRNGRCIGTREIDICNCKGNEGKYDFYPEKRTRKMKDKNNKTIHSTEKNVRLVIEIPEEKLADFRLMTVINGGKIVSAEKIVPVKVTCYGKTETYSSIDEAKAFYLECMASSEGSEQSRYASIVAQLEAGMTECSDEKEDY